MTRTARLNSTARPSTLDAMAESELSSRPRSWIWWGAAVVALVLGYADLMRGGITIAPILLTLGYCVLVPVAILRR